VTANAAHGRNGETLKHWGCSRRILDQIAAWTSPRHVAVG
jgi:hypothetical protein